MKFYNKFNLAENKYKTYDRSDKVDRLTYVDPVLQIKNFFRAGSQTALQRGQFLYESADAALAEGDTWSVPVYQKDIVDATVEMDRLTGIRNHYREQYNILMDERRATMQKPKTEPQTE